MNPVRFSVENPYTVAVGVIFSALFSLIALQRIPIQLKPTVDKPQINVSTTYRGASAVEVEEQVTRELEDVLQSVQGLVKLTSDSSAGRSQITLEFELGTNTRLAMIDVVNKLSQAPPLPDEADEPAVEIASSDEQQPVMWIAVRTSYDPNRTRRVVIDEVEPRLKRVEGVSSLLVVGGSPREVQVRIDPGELVARGVTLRELFDALSRGVINVRGGTVETRTRQLVVRTLGKPDAVQELTGLVVKSTPRGVVRLGELATVIDGYEETPSFVSVSGQPGVAMGVRRQVGSNVVQVIRDVDAAREELNRSFRSRGMDLELEGIYRETTYIDAAIEFVTGNLWMGGLLAVGVLFTFLRSLRSTLVVALSIPVSLLGVFLVMHAAGRTLNVISLAGIAFASGMVVDNAVVVLENVFRHLEMGKRPLEAAVEGGLEVWGGVLASTLTTVAVFVPVLLQQDEASQLFRDLALTISVAVVLSLVVGLTVVPVLTHLLFRNAPVPAGLAAQETPGGAAQLGPIGRAYDRFLAHLGEPRPGAWAWKVGFCLLVCAISLASVSLAPKAEYLPGGNRNLVMFFASPVPGTRAEAARENFHPLERFLLSQPETDRTFAVISPRFNGGGVVLKEELATPETLAAFHQRLFAPAATLAGFRFVVPLRASLFSDPGKQFEVEVSGPDFAALEGAAQRLQQRLGEVNGVQFVRSSLVTGNPEVRVRIDEDRAKAIGLDTLEVGQAVETMIAGRRLTTLIDGGREVDVNLVAPQEAIGSAEDLAALRFLTRDGREVALGNVASVVQTTGPESIRHLERQRSVLLTVNIAPDAPLEAVVDTVEGEVFPELSRQLGPAYSLVVAGSADKLRTTLSALTGGFWLSVLITYLLLVALFRSWFAPVVILITVPLAMTGGLVGIRLAHWWSGGQASFDVIGMLGFVILAGLVVNNAILILHQANNFVEQGLERRRALVESARSRLRPILITVLTTVVGMLPLAIGGGAGAELYQGLAAIIVGGLSLSTLFTLFLVPVILSLGHDLTETRTPALPAPVAEPVREVASAPAS